ncbi:right-handed parallel beta-helix repeat-containing protein [Candidatus Woesearchaeota archaeon]|nr:right-handed parallel beta-helix repeat-containing protein [Candidatus Woesearchaeota archaeon]
MSFLLGNNFSQLNSYETEFGKIEWTTRFHSVKSISGVQIEKNLISIDSKNFPELNSPAYIIFYNVSNGLKLFRDGKICTDCEFISNEDGNLIFYVTHFSSYTLNDTYRLDIWDSQENKSIAISRDAVFYANYTNNSVFLSNATCTIHFSDGSFAMNVDSTKKNYNYTRSFSSSGTKNWNVTCALSGYPTLTIQDNIIVKELVIINHNSVSLYDDIPAYYLDEIKKMWFNIAGESHSRGYRYGLNLLEQFNSNYSVDISQYSPLTYATDELRVSNVVWNGGSWEEFTGESRWYTWNAYDTISSASENYIPSHINYSNSNGYVLSAIGFGWCWDMTWMNDVGGTTDSEYGTRWAGASDGGPDGDLRWGLDDDDYSLTGNRVNMDDYLQATQKYINYVENYFTNTTVFFTTGPVDSDYNDNSDTELGYQRELKHNYIRNYVNETGGFLFDYADILVYNDSDVLTTCSWNGHTYPDYSPTNNYDYDESWNYEAYSAEGETDHIGEVGALRIGKAIWVLLARIAGWDGTVNESSINTTPVFDNFDGSTTDFSLYNSTELENITNATIESVNFGKIKFIVPINFSNLNLNSLIQISNKSIYVNTTASSKLNVQAELTFYEVNYLNPLILVDGDVCTECQILLYSDGNLTFNVTHFSNYTIQDATELSIFDSKESSYANIDESVNFYANYTNNSVFISGATCNISFEDGSYLMTEGVDLYNYTRNFSTSGTKEWNVSCNSTGFAWLNLTDNVEIASVIEISGCANISSPGTYILTANILNSAKSYCINISTSNVTLNCQGNTIDGNDIADNGIYVRNILGGTTTLENISIVNCVVSDWDTDGIVFNRITSGEIINTNISSSIEGIHFISSGNINLEEINIDGVSLGILTESSSNLNFTNMSIHNSNSSMSLEYTGNTISTNLNLTNTNRSIFIWVTCGHTFNNVTVGQGLPLKYYENSNGIIIENNNSIGALQLCNVDNSIIRNISIINNEGIYSTSSEHNNFSDLFISNSTDSGLEFDRDSDYNLVEDSEIYYAANSGVTIYYGDYNTIDNVDFTGNSYGVDILRNSYHNTIKNSNFFDNFLSVLIEQTSSNNTFHDNVISSTMAGVYIYDTSSTYPNSIYNNFINATYNVYFDGGTNTQFFNTTNQTGTRIYSSGTNIGGNYWSNPTNTGFSDLCTDSDTDGFCDLAYDVIAESSCVVGSNCSSNTDYLPLSDEFIGTVIQITNCTNITSEGEYVLANDILNSTQYICINVSEDNVSIDCQGHVIDGIKTQFSSGIYTDQNDAIGFRNISLKNCILTDWHYGVYFADSVLIRIENSTFTSNYDGLAIYDSGNVTIIDILSENNTGDGFSIVGVSNVTMINDTIRNNYGGDIEVRGLYDSNVFTNVTGTGDLPIVYYTGEIHLQNWNNNFSQMILTYIGDSTLENITLNRTNYLGSSMYIQVSENVSLRNVTIQKVGSGVSCYGCQYLNVTNSFFSVRNDALRGGSNVYLDNSTIKDSETGLIIEISNSSIKNCIFENNTNGINIWGYNPGENNSIYNNLFNNTNNIIFSGNIYDNFWNITNQTGEKIFSTGTNIGGNFWAEQTGLGYSQLCFDLDKDGFCDLAYDVINDVGCTKGIDCSNNTDYLPYSNYDLINPTIISLINKSYIHSVIFEIETDEFTNVTINYGPSSSLGIFEYDANHSRQHSIYVGGLSENVTYYYNLTLCDLYLNCYTYSTYNFTTDNSSVLRDGLIGYWSFDDGNGTLSATIEDLSENGNNGTITDDGVEVTNGLVGPYALSFNATSGYINIPYDASMDSLNMTISTWITNDDATYSTYAYIRKEGEWHIRKGSGNWEFTGEGGLDGFSSDWDFVNNQNEWHLHTVTIDSTNRELKFYVDGIQYGVTQTISTDKPISGNGIFIGRYNQDYRWQGDLDDVRIYNRVLDEIQVYELYDEAYQIYPIVNNTQVITTNESANIIFDVNQNSNATINYGLTTNLGNYEYDTTYSTYHNIPIISLTNNTLYYYNITVCRLNGYCNTTGPYNFTTDATNTHYISGCTNITSSGIYILTANIINSATNYCINISANNVTFDGQGYTLDGNNAADYGIYVGRSSLMNTNVTVKNITLTNWDTAAINYYQAMRNSIEHINITSNPDIGINLDYSDYNNVSYVVGSENMGSAITINSYSDYNIIDHIDIKNNPTGVFIAYSGAIQNLLKNSRILNSSNYDIRFVSGSTSECNNNISNVTGTGNKPIFHSNGPVNIDGWNNNVSMISLCNSDYSNISNVVLDYEYHGGNKIILYQTDYSNFSNITIRNAERGIYASSCANNYFSNLNLSDSTFGFYLFWTNSINNLFNNSYFFNNTYGLYMDNDINNITIINSQIINNTNGIVFGGLLGPNTLYNNYFGNTNNVILGGSAYTHSFNTTSQVGARIYSSGTNIGGNYWSNPTRTGYSDTCTDSDTNGFCDSAYNISTGTSCIVGLDCGNNTDYLPLSNLYSVDILAPVISSLVNTTTNESVTITFTTNEAANLTINYGTMLESSLSNTSFSILHNESITGLTNNTMYYYNITVCDSLGNCNTTNTYNFTTKQNTGSLIYNLSAFYTGSTIVNSSINFFANYSNNSVLISGATCNISFYDGTISMTEGINLYNYTRNFSSEGTYDWNISCYKTGYLTLQENNSITINNASVRSVIEVFRDTGMVPYTVLFNAKNSSSDFGEIIRYDWNFNESNNKYSQTDNGRLVGHMFNSSGIFNVSLTVTDEQGNNDTSYITITVVPVPVTAETYYIASDGNDSNNGTSPLFPWKTTAKINAMASSMPNGSQILFRRNDTFDLENNTWFLDENLIRAGPEYIKLGAYGTGNKPYIYCENCSSDGTINTNQRTEGNGIIIEDIHFSGFLWLMPTYYSMTQPTGFREPGLQIIVRNLDLYPDGNLGVWSSSGVTMEDCYVDNTQSGVGFGSSNWPGINYFYANHIEVENAYSHCVYFADAGKNILFENGDLHDCGIYGTLRDGFTVHGVFDNVIVRNNTIHNNGYAMGIIDGYMSDVPSEVMSNVIVEENKIYNQVSFGIQLSSIVNFTFRNNLMYNNLQGTAINSNILLLTPSNMEGLIDNDSVNVNFYNNVFYGNEYTIFYIEDDQVSDVKIKNNIFMNNNPNGEFFINLENSSDINLSNNLYYNNTNPAFRVSGSTYNLVDWLSSGLDSNSINADPLFYNLPSADFRILNSSPAIDNGTQVDAHYDFVENLRPVGANFDIGAYEYALDGIAPSISNLLNISTNESVTITFTTNEAANVSINSGTTIILGTKNSNSSFATTINLTINGLTNNTSYYYNITVCDVVNNCNTIGPYSFTTLQTPDTINPVWSGNTTYLVSPTYQQSQNHQFNITWSDNHLDSVIFETNFSGIPQNVSSSGNLGNEYYYNIANLAAGTYYWKSYANDTSSNENETSLFMYTVSKASTAINLLLNSTDGNIAIEQNSLLNMTVNSAIAGTLRLYQNGTLLNTSTSNFTRIINETELGYFNITAMYVENTNYTSSIETHFLTVHNQYILELSDSLNKSYADINESITFFANYSNFSVHISASTCNITFSDGNWSLMTENTSNYNFTRNFSNNGTYLYNVTCNKTGYPTLTKNSSVQIGCIESWSCGSWSTCTGTQSRTCTDANSCGTTLNQPVLIQSCTVTTSSSGGGGGSSGGGSAGGGSSIPESANSISKTWSMVSQGDVLDWNITGHEIARVVSTPLTTGFLSKIVITLDNESELPAFNLSGINADFEHSTAIVKVPKDSYDYFEMQYEAEPTENITKVYSDELYDYYETELSGEGFYKVYGKNNIIYNKVEEQNITGEVINESMVNETIDEIITEPTSKSNPLFLVTVLVTLLFGGIASVLKLNPQILSKLHKIPKKNIVQSEYKSEKITKNKSKVRRTTKK